MMLYKWILVLLFFVIFINSCKTQNKESTKQESAPMEWNTLNDFEKYVIESKGTERPFTGEYTDYKKKGTYLCKKCNTPLYTSSNKFSSNCGWPSFDDEIAGTVKRVLDKDGRRVEIICNHCEGHLGHVFEGEGFTEKNTRHCVNSVSLNFVPKGETLPEILNKTAIHTDTATFGAGCFWCVEAMFLQLKGVLHVESGYAAGKIKNPTYKMVCAGGTEAVEVIQVVFDTSVISYETLVDILFHVHDPTTLNRQGNDVGDQYRSVIFYHSEVQQKIADKVLKRIEASDLWPDPIVTSIEPLYNYSTAEDYHQNYFNQNKNSNSYCSMVVAPKVKKFQLKYKDLLK